MRARALIVISSMATFARVQPAQLPTLSHAPAHMTSGAPGSQGEATPLATTPVSMLRGTAGVQPSSTSRQILDGPAGEFFLRRAADNSVVVVFTDQGYLPVLLNWVAYGITSGSLGDNFAIVCIDAGAKQSIEALGGECYQLPEAPAEVKNLGEIWYMRMLLVSDLLQMGLDVLLTDADAMWIGDPMPMVQDSTADIVASRGSFPTAEAQTWGATLCMGFIFFRATEASKTTLEVVISSKSAQGTGGFDDQLTLNVILAHFGLHWDHKLSYEDSLDVDHGKTELNSVSVALLPHSKFMRICPEVLPPQVLVAHCLSAKTSSSKEDELSQQGLWVWSPNMDWTLKGRSAAAAAVP